MRAPRQIVLPVVASAVVVGGLFVAVTAWTRPAKPVRTARVAPITANPVAANPVAANPVAGTKTSVVVRPVARKWRVKSPARVGSAGSVAARWKSLRAGLRPWIAYRPTLDAMAGRSQSAGDITLSGVLLRNVDDGQTYGLLRLASTLDLVRPAELPIRWQHHVAFYADSFPGAGAALASRTLVTVRRAQLGILAGPVTANIGRVWAADAAMASAVDGASATFAASEHVKVTAWGGVSPTVQGYSRQTDVARTGGSLAWQADEDGNLRGAVAWSSAFVQGRMDDQRIGLQLHASDPEIGGISGALDIGIGFGDLSGTSLADSALAKPTGAVVRPMRAWLSLWNRPRANWQLRGWYSFHRTEATRELALAQAWDTMVAGAGHAMNLSISRRFSGSWWWRQRLWGSWNDFGDYNDGLRLGTELRAGHNGEFARPFLWLRGESGLDVGTAGIGLRTSLAASGGLGTRLALSRNVAVDLRGGVRYDDLIASASSALRGRARAGLELSHGRWLWLLSVSGDAHLVGSGDASWKATDFVEAMAMARFRL